jgi:hypothetical protein
MSFLNDFMKGLEFSVYGVVGDAFSFENEQKQRQRFVRVISAGKTYNFPIETETDFQKFKELRGSLVRASGTIIRNKNSASVKPQIKNVSVSGQSDWKEPSESDFFSGCSVVGYVRVQNKRSGVYSGNAYSKVQIMSFGDVFELNHVPADLFERLPESGMVLIRCHTEPRLGRTENSRVTELDLVLEAFKPVDLSSASQSSQSSSPPSSGRAKAS